MIETLVPLDVAPSSAHEPTTAPLPDKVAQQAEADYKLTKYYEWLNETRSKATPDPAFAARCVAAQREARERTAKASYIHPDYRVEFRVPGSSAVTPEERIAALTSIEEGIRARRFAQPALKAVFSQPHAQFIDDFVRYCSEVEPNEVVLASSYTEQGDLISVKSLSHPSDPDSEIRHRVVIGDIHNQTVTQYRVNDIEMNPSKPSMRLVCTTDRFDQIDGQPTLDTTHPVEGLLALNDDIMQQHIRHQRQVYVELSAHSIIYKPFDGKERSAPSLDQMTYDRYMLTRLAMAAGLTVIQPKLAVAQEGMPSRGIA